MRPQGKPVQSPTSSWPSRLALIVALAAILARRADASSVLPLALALPIEVLTILLCVRRISRGDLLLLIAVTIGALAFVCSRAAWSLALTAPILFILGLECGNWLQSMYQRVEQFIDQPRRVLQAIIGPWLALIVTGTVLLSLPIATRSGVPDYAHNFWLHIVTCGFTAASAASLMGGSIYSFSEDFTRMGQGVTLLITQLAGLGFVAIALSIVRPWLSRPCRLATLCRCIFVSQALAAIMVFVAWPKVDAASATDRFWTSVFYSIGAAFNAGFTLKPAGLAHVIGVPAIFITITTLAIVGSIGWPFVLDILQWARGKRPEPQRGGLAEIDVFIALLLLLGTAFVLLLCETPGSLSTGAIPSRPVDFGASVVSIRDNMPLGRRWSLAVFIAATLRSSGLQSIPLSPGGISLPSYFLMLIMMLIGGSIAGAAGGLRTTTLALPLLSLLRRDASTVTRNSMLETRSCLLFIPIWLAANLAAILALRSVTDGTWYEIALDAAAAFNSVGLSTGLTLHLTTFGRLVMILVILAGRWGPILYWSAFVRSSLADTELNPQEKLQ